MEDHNLTEMNLNENGVSQITLNTNINTQSNVQTELGGAQSQVYLQ